MRSMFPYVLYILNSTIIYGNATPTNFTIDDEQGDQITGIKPAYSPVRGWNQGSSCSDCTAKPNAAQTFMGTWHDATYRPTSSEPRVITLSFNGTAIYTYFILANTHTDDSSQLFPHTVLTFILDNIPLAGNFRHEPQNNTGFEYNVPVYTNTTLPAGPHELQIVASGPTTIIMLFDYAVYTSDPDAPAASNGSDNGSGDNTASSSKTNVSAIVGGTVGGVLVVCLIGAALVFLRRHYQTRGVADIDDGEEYTTHELPGQAPIYPLYPHGGDTFVSASASVPYQIHTTPDPFYESTVQQSQLTSSAPTQFSGAWEVQSIAGLTRKEMERRREHLESRMREMQESITGSDEIRPEDSASRAVETTAASRAVPDNENSEIRQIVEGLRTEIAQLSAQLERHNYRNEPPPAYRTSCLDV